MQEKESPGKQEDIDYKLQTWEIQQFLEDIEKEGGRKIDNGKQIYDSRDAIYGSQGSAKRKAFRKFKNNLRRQSIQTYWKESILGRQVQPHPLTLAEYQAYQTLLSSKTSLASADPETMDVGDPWEDEVHPDDTGGEVKEVKFKKIDDAGPALGGVQQQKAPPVQQFSPARFPKLAEKPKAPVVKHAPLMPPYGSPPAVFSNATSTLDESFTDAFSNMSFSEAGDAFPYGDGSKEKPIFVLADFKHPERNHGFVVHAFANMLCDGRTRNIIEISHPASLCDLEGTILLYFVTFIDPCLAGDFEWKACLPESGVPSSLFGRVVHIKKPSLPLVYRDANTYTNRAQINCGSARVKRDQDVKAIKDDKGRHYIHYYFVFPFQVDHRIFNDNNDGDLEIHRFNVSVILPDNHVDNPTNGPLIELTVGWRIGKHGATDTSSAQKRAINYGQLIA